MPVRSRRSPEFRRFFVAHATSRAGDAFNAVALVVLVYRLTDSGIGVAATVAFEVLPVLALGPVAGLLADRYPRRRVMIAADLLRAAAAATLAISHTSVGLAFAVAFFLSTGAVIFNPASSSLVPDLVEPDDLVDANASLWTVAVAAQVLLAPLAGGLIAVLGIGVAFWINSASFLLSALVLLTMNAGRTPASLVVRGWHGVREGVGAVRGHPLLARLAIVQVLASLSAGATGGLLVVLAEERFDVGPSGFGLLLAAIGTGAASGPTLFRRWIKPSDRRWLFLPFAARGAVDFVLAIVRVPLVGGAALTVYGMSTSTGMVAYQSTLQREVVPELRGRAFALYDVLWNSARLLSLGLGGLLAEALGVQAVYLLGGALLLAAAAVGMTAPLKGGTDSPLDAEEKRGQIL